MIQQIFIGLRHLKYKLNRRLKSPSIDHPPSLIKDHWMQFQKEGLVVLPNFLDHSLCQELIDETNRLHKKHADLLQCGPWQADVRLYGAENGSEKIRSHFCKNDFINHFCQQHLGDNAQLMFCLASCLNFKEKNNGSGNGWHRDSYTNQFKAIIYLNDVREETGPFEFIKGSHHLQSILETHKLTKSHWQNTRYEDEKIDSLIDKSKKEKIRVTGKAGTLILANTSGLHRGAPIKKGVRYSLTNYYWHELPTPEQLIHFEPYLG